MGLFKANGRKELQEIRQFRRFELCLFSLLL